MTFELRDYQEDAFLATVDFLKNQSGNPLIVAPTASGKSLIIAAIVRAAKNRKVLVLQHRKELIEQNFNKIKKLCPDNYVTIYSASVGQKNIRGNCVVAGIQSIVKNSFYLPSIDFVIIDECHLLPPDGEGMYQQLLKTLLAKNPAMRVIGLTATPFRMTTGSLIDDAGLFTDIAYNIEIKRLIKDGWLSPLVSKSAVSTPDTSQLHVRKGEFITSESEKLFIDEALTISALSEIATYAKERKSILVFCSSVKHAEFFTKFLKQNNESAEMIDGELGMFFREQILEKFKKGYIRFLVNVDVLTTGFDAPNVDCIVCLRPTKSPGLWVQMVGRGMRLSPETGKQNCLVLDFGGNIDRHGPIDEIEVKKKAKKQANGEIRIGSEVSTAADNIKVCLKCRSIASKETEICPDCGTRFPIEVKHDIEATNSSPMSADTPPEAHTVQEIFYKKHEKEGKPPSFRVEYKLGFNFSVSDYLCLEHGGFARKMAVQKWRTLATDPNSIPDSVDQALILSETGHLKKITKIEIQRDGKFWKILRYKFYNPESGNAPPPTITERVEPLVQEETHEWEIPGENLKTYDDDSIPF